MRGRMIRRAVLIGAIGVLVLGAPALAQYREYYVRGKVVGTDQRPIPGW